MFKLVVLSALIALAAAKPSFHSAPALIAEPVVTPVHKTIVSAPIIKTYGAPVVNAIPSAYASYVSPVISNSYGSYSGYGNSYGSSYVSAPIVKSYAAPVVGYGSVGYSSYSSPIGYGSYGSYSSY